MSNPSPESTRTIALLTPPLGNLTQPYCSTAYLTGFLRDRGYHVLQYDLGIKTVDLMLTPDHLSSLHRRVQALLATDPSDQLRTADLSAPAIIARVLEAKSILRDPDRFYLPPDYRFAVNIVSQAFSLIGAASGIDKIAFNTLPRGERLLLESFDRLTTDPRHNAFLAPLRDLALPEALPEAPAVVGLSIAFNQQIFPGYTLARLLKEKFPFTHIVMGGAALAQAESRLRRDPRAFDWVDSYIFGEGETPLAELLELVFAGRLDHSDSRRLFLKAQAGSPAPASGWDRESYDELPPPDYTGLNLADYLSPEPVFLLANARGCYWNKCSFCNVSLSFKSGFQKRSASHLERDLRCLRERHQARLIFFSDDGMPPRRCREVARISRELDPPLWWQTMVRFETGFTPEVLREMREGGCLQLAFGFESASQHVLDLMNKGTRHEVNAKIIRDAHEAGIAVYLYTMLGFPGETMEDAQTTIDFLDQSRDLVASVCFHYFFLAESSPVQVRPDDFGIAGLQLVDPDELAPEYSFETESGLSRREASAVYRGGLDNMARSYPGSGYFFDNLFSAHGLLYLAHFGAERLAEIFRDRPITRDLLAQRPRLMPGVKKLRLSRGNLYLFNPATGRHLDLDPGAAVWLELMDGTRTIKEMVRREPPGSAADLGARTAQLMSLVVTLFQEEHLELE